MEKRSQVVRRRPQTPDDLFKDAKRLMKIATRDLAVGDIRQAAERAWRATVASTRGLLLAKTGVRPQTAFLTRIGIEEAADQDQRLGDIRNRFFTREQTLHIRCFYEGDCEPRAAIERRVRETADFIHDVRDLTLAEEFRMKEKRVTC